ncbi:MAG: MraY family glycosyltransferase [Proteobacteria bacterium]|nr:MraY family glycosyltransferase [Pseudomonadota bacterium]
MIYLSSTFLLSLFVTIPIIPILIRVAERFHALDMPDERKVHSHPIPRIGGIAMVIGTFATAFLWADSSPFFKAYAIGIAIIVAFGLIDDLKQLDYRVKFGAQLLASFIIVFYGDIKIDDLGAMLPEGYALPVWISVPLTVFVIVGVTNAINLADGLDGLAGGISLISLCCIGYLAYIQENTIISFLAISLIGAVFGFLRFNTHPATLFMGDTGSQFLGFSLIVMLLSITQEDTALSPVLPLIILGFPVLDTLTVMGERIANGRSPFKPDKNHFHHRLMRLGFYHNESVFIIYVIHTLFVTSAFVLRYHYEWVLLGGYLILSGLVLGFFFISDKKAWRIRHIDIIDHAIKGRFADIIKEKGLLIKIPFKCIEIGIPILLICTCFFPMKIPKFFPIISISFIVLIVAAWFFKRNWLRGVLTFSLYGFIPIIVFLTYTDERVSDMGIYSIPYNLSFFAIIFFVVMTLRFTKRRKGFKATTMDFLILLVALIAPYLAGTYLQYKELGAVAAKTIALYFSYEVLIGELRGELGRITLATIVALMVVVVRGIM